jgi:hypothetical protein
MLTAFLLWGSGGWAAGPHTFWLGPHWVGPIVGGRWLIFRGGPGAPRADGRSGAERATEVLAERHARGGISADGCRARSAHLRGSGA